MNRVNSRNGSAMMTAPETLSCLLLLLLLLLLLSRGKQRIGPIYTAVCNSKLSKCADLFYLMKYASLVKIIIANRTIFDACVQFAESSPTTAWSHRFPRYREALCREVRRQPSQQRPQRPTFHPCTDSKRPRSLRWRQRPKRLGSPGENNILPLYYNSVTSVTFCNPLTLYGT